jgi:hypothetical protein
MSVWTNIAPKLLIGLALSLCLSAQNTDSRPFSAQSVMNLKINGTDSPVQLVAADWGNSSYSPRGGLVQLDLKTSIVMQNVGRQQIRGVSLRVVANDLTPGGKGSVTVPSLRINPGEKFQVRVDLRLLSPMPKAGEPVIEVSLDGVLLENYSFFGPDEMRLRQSLVAWEMESRRDRDRFKKTLAQGGQDRLQAMLVDSVARLQAAADRSSRVKRTGRATNREPEQELKLAAVRVPQAPVELLDGFLKVAGNEIRQPQIAVMNHGRQTVTSIEVGLRIWGVDGKDYIAPLAPADLTLNSGERKLVQSRDLFEIGGRAPVAIRDAEAFISRVAFKDGRVWTPSAKELSDPEWRRRLNPSPEEMRIADLYRRKGIQAVMADLSEREDD